MQPELDHHLSAYQGGQLYDFDNHIQKKWYPPRVIAHAPGARSMLELGVGHGITLTLFGAHFERYVVVDASPAVIKNFRSAHPDSPAEIIEAFFEEFETEERFDVIMLGFVLEHVEDPVLVLQRFRRFLAPGGRAFVTVPNAEVMNRRLGHLAGLLPDMQTLSEHDHLLGHRRYYTVDSLRADIQRAGYELLRMEGIYLKPLATRQMLSLALDERIIDALCQMGVHYPELSCGLLAEIVPQADVQADVLAKDGSAP